MRALAVIPVVLYHLDERLVPGGFVGVDIFFVISGYLITVLLARDLGERRFSLLTFYDRRVRRIVPAYAAVALVVSVAALVLLPPGMLVAFGKSLQAASTFLANRYFLSATGYFGAAPDEQWLLHTWSLSVEEQFYLAWPLLLALLFHPRLARIRPYVIWALIVASLVVSTRNAVFRPACLLQFRWALLGIAAGRRARARLPAAPAHALAGGRGGGRGPVAHRLCLCHV